MDKRFLNDSDSTEVISSSDEEDRWKEVSKSVNFDDVMSEHRKIPKLVKWLKSANPTATILTLSFLLELDLKESKNQMAFLETGGLEVLVNLLDSPNLTCRVLCLRIIIDLTLHIDIRRTIVDLDVVPVLIKLLVEPAQDVKTLAAEVIANIGKVRLCRKLVRKNGGIPALVDMLDVKLEILTTPKNLLSTFDIQNIQMVSAASKALKILSQSKRNAEIMQKYGSVPLIGRLLKSIHLEVLVPIMAACQTCAIQTTFNLAIITENMIVDIVSHLNSANIDLRTEACNALFRCGNFDQGGERVHKAHGFDILIGMLKENYFLENTNYVIALTGAIWKCSYLKENAEKLAELEAMRSLVKLLFSENNEILTNTTGAIATSVKLQKNQEAFRLAGGLPPLVNLLNTIHEPVLINVAKTIRRCSFDPKGMKIIDSLDGIRLIWSLLKNSDPEVVAHAAWALCPCIDNESESGEVVRSLVGGIGLLIKLLSSKNATVLASICAAIATIGKDNRNVAILTEHRVIYVLADLVTTKDEMLREYLTAAIATCAPYGNNKTLLRNLRVITPISGYLINGNPGIIRNTIKALNKLSECPICCIELHQNGVVPTILKSIESSDPQLQNAAVSCLKNMRETVLKAYKMKYMLD